MGKPLRVLIVEDSEDDALLLVRTLQKGGYDLAYERVETADAMNEALERETWDIVISDYSMPHFNGHEALVLFKEKELEIPFIIVSGTIGEEAAVAIMISGAHDYVMKSNLSRLLPAVRRELKEAQTRRECKRAEEKLLESKILFEAVVESIPLMIFLKEAIDLRFVIFNLAGEDLLGYDRRDLIGKNNLDLFPPEQATNFMVKDREVLDGVAGMLDIPEEPIMTAGKGERILHTRKVCVRGPDGATKYLLGISEDITERKQAQEELRDSEERFRRMFHGHNAIMLLIDQETGAIRDANHSAARFYGYSTERLCQMNIKDINTLDAEEVAHQLTLAIAEKRNYFIFPHCLASGEVKTVEVHSSPITIRDGTILFSIIHDITDRKQAEEMLKNTLDRLRRAFGTIVQVMVSAVERRDPYTAGHQKRSADIACTIAKEMGMPQEKIDGIRMAGSIPAEILSKPTKLTDVEFSLVKEHSRGGYEILKDVESPWPLAEIVYQHHERMDGSGYPRNLKGEEIIIEARIMAVADVVESMASHRPYRPALGNDAALEEIEKNKGTLYDASVVDACLKLFREKRFQFQERSF